jgi:hypothetical protein
VTELRARGQWPEVEDDGRGAAAGGAQPVPHVGRDPQAGALGHAVRRAVEVGNDGA